MATIKDAIKELEELKEKFDEDSEIVMVVFTKDDINLGCEYCNYDDVDEATKLLEGIDWTDVLYQLVSERGIDILGDIIEDLVNGNSPYITNGNPRFKLGDKVYCHQETDWYEFPITEIYWDDEYEMYIYSNDADEIFCADMLTLVPYKRDE